MPKIPYFLHITGTLKPLIREYFALNNLLKCQKPDIPQSKILLI